MPDVIDTLFQRLVWTTIQATILIGALWLLERHLRRMPPAVRCMLWWLVAAQLLLGMTVSTPVQLRWLPAPTPAPTAMVHVDVADSTMGTVSTHPTRTAVSQEASSLALPTHAPWSWPRVVVSLWLLGVLLQSLFAVRQWRESRLLIRDSQPLRDTSLQGLCAEQADHLGLRHIPHLRTCESIASPQVTGLWRPLVLLPSGHKLSTEELSMALAHELAHLRRGDLWLGWIPAIAERLFFFHPLVRWAMREYAVYREAACDAKVLEQERTAPQSYGHLLLRLGVAHPVHTGLAGASSTFESLKRRLLLLQLSAGDASPRAAGWVLVAVIALIGVLPYRVTAANAAPTSSQDSLAVPPAPPAAPAAPVAELSVPPAPATPPAPPAPPVAPAKPLLSFVSNIDIDTQPRANRGFALIDGNTIIVRGSNEDESDAERLRKNGAPVMWFRRDGKAYVVRDAGLIEQARQAYAPVSQMAQEQGKFAGKQGALAGQQSGLAARQSALAGREAELASRRAAIESQQASLRADSGSASDAAQAALMKGQLAGMDKEAAEMSRENETLNRSMADLDKRAAELSQRGSEMSRQQQAATRRAEQQLDQVLNEALAKGLAIPVNR
nr:M56 family metallopeptidase [Dyella mobilis]